MDMSSFHLTSTVISPSADGDYKYHNLCFLIPNEAFRRELARAEVALGNFNVDIHPWKAAMFHEWFTTLLLPAINYRHHLEADIIFPFFLSLGLEVPSSQIEDHLWIVCQMNKIKNQANLVKNLSSGKFLSDDLSNEVQVLRQDFDLLASNLKAHFNAKEIFWPPILKKYGKV